MVARGMHGGKITGGEAESTLEDPAEKGAPETGIADGALAGTKLGTQDAALKAATIDEAPAGDEATPETDPRLKRYKDRYDRWPLDLKIKFPWPIVQSRLLTDIAEGGEPLLTDEEGLREAERFGIDAKRYPFLAVIFKNP